MQKVKLLKTQKLLWQLITAPEGVAKGMRQFKVTQLPLRGGDRLSAIARLDIYAGMYFYRIRDSLAEDYAAVYKVLGPARFNNLVTDYLLRFSPTHFSLSYAGQHLPTFLEQHALTKVYKFLPDLARMEWQILQVFEAPDSSVLELEDLQKIPPEKWPGLQFHLTPSFNLVHFKWPIVDIRKGILQNKTATAYRKKMTAVIFWRKDYKVFLKKVDPAEELILQSLLRHKKFDALCAALSKKIMDSSQAVSTVARVLQGIVSEGLCSTAALV